MNTTHLETKELVCAADPWDFAFDPVHTAVLVIDMQNDFCAIGGYCHAYMAKQGIGDAAIALLREPLEPLANVLDAARVAGIPVIYTVEAHWPDLADVPSNKMQGTVKVGAPIGSNGPLGRLLIRGERGSAIVDELAPRPGEHVVQKPGKGAFFATDLDHILRNQGVTHLIITGVTTDCCVLATRMEARDRGYHTLQLEDCCAATQRKNHDAVFAMIRTHPEAFGLMSSSQALLFALGEA
ncbi:MAG: cysteine hydrolase family protein [Solirubrobacteraceae bacterium]